MRKIKFRGKVQFNGNHKFSGEWVYGYYRNNDNGNAFITETLDELDNYIFEETEIDVNTLGQYTGLEDKNGKEIYEGDIVRLKMKYEDDEDIIGAVKFGTFLHSKCREYTCYHYGYYIDYKWQDNTGYDLYEAFINISIEYCEVIGNIYDNPELLD